MAHVDLRSGGIGQVIRPPAPEECVLAGGETAGRHRLGGPGPQTPVIVQLARHHAWEVRLHRHQVDDVERAGPLVTAGDETQRAGIHLIAHRQPPLGVGVRRDLDALLALDQHALLVGLLDRPPAGVPADPHRTAQNLLLLVAERQTQPLLGLTDPNQGPGPPRAVDADSKHRLLGGQGRPARRSTRCAERHLLLIRAGPGPAAGDQRHRGRGRKMRQEQSSGRDANLWSLHDPDGPSR